MALFAYDNCRVRGGRNTQGRLVRPGQDALQEYESRISRNPRAFLEVGRALREIKRRRLYRAGFGSFAEYCQIRWNLKRSHAYRYTDLLVH